LQHLFFINFRRRLAPEDNQMIWGARGAVRNSGMGAGKTPLRASAHSLMPLLVKPVSLLRFNPSWPPRPA
jgi:hypothetical protein